MNYQATNGTKVKKVGVNSTRSDDSGRASLSFCP